MHPLYGVKNWLAVFAIGGLLGGMRELGDLNGEAHKVGLTITEFLAVDHPATSFAKFSLWLNVGIASVIYWTLFTKNLKFRLIASSLLISYWPMTALLGIAFPFEGLGGVLALSIFPWAISCGVWVTYLNRSKRVRVTFENEILVEFLEGVLIPASEPSKNRVRSKPQNKYALSADQRDASDIPIAVPQLRHRPTTADANPEAGIEDAIWAAAMKEIEDGSRRPGLWAKCYSEANGQESGAKAAYIRVRFEELKQEQLGRQESSRQDESEAALRHATAKANDAKNIDALNEAIARGDVEAVKELLLTGVNVKQRDWFGLSPWACAHSHERIEIIALLESSLAVRGDA